MNRTEQKYETVHDAIETRDVKGWYDGDLIPHLIAPCGEKVRVEYNNKDQFATEHMQCPVCLKVLGLSKREKGFTQNQVARLFTAGLTGETGTENYSSEIYHVNNLETGEIVDTPRTYHYGVLNAIKTFQGKVIVNSEDYGGGFAYVTYPEHDHILPLSTIRNFHRDPENIKILETKDRLTLLELDGKCLLIGRDEGQQFIVELVAPVTTIKGAYVSMRPQVVKDAEQSGVKTVRQGDLFFIEQPHIRDADVTDIQKIEKHIRSNWHDDGFQPA